MEPLNDKELSSLLQQWKAPPAPAGLSEKFFPGGGTLPWWRRLWRGSIRVPVPLGVVLIALLTLSAWFGLSHRSPVPPRAVSLADFQPVKQLQPRIIRSEYAGN